MYTYLLKCFPGGSDGKASVCNAGDLGLIPGLGTSPEEGNSSPLQYLAWKIPWTEEAGGLQAIGSQSQTWLRDLTSLTMSFGYKYICPLHDNYTLKVFKFKINWPNLHIKVKKYKQLTRKLGKAHRHVRRIVNSYKSEATCSTFHTKFRNCCMRVSWEKKGNSFIYNKNVNS